MINLTLLLNQKMFVIVKVKNTMKFPTVKCLGFSTNTRQFQIYFGAKMNVVYQAIHVRMFCLFSHSRYEGDLCNLNTPKYCGAIKS